MAQRADMVTENGYLERLRAMREHAGVPLTTGLDDATISAFLAAQPALGTAIDQAFATFEALKASRPGFLALDEADQVREAQAQIVNFYARDAVNPYIAAGAKGPWVVTLKGAVVYDCGGYGMLGLGHAPDAILDAMNKPHVMANVMTPSITHKTFIEALTNELGHSRPGGSPFTHFLALNSGSESVTIASRLADVNAKELTEPGARHAGKRVHGLSLKGSFHGRTDRPARYSDSSIRAYRKHLRSFEDKDYLLTVEPNDVDALDAVFARAESEGFFIEAMFMEPVMGEGNPGQAITPEFYARARELTLAHGSLLLIDSIQAGLRAHGVLSIVDYPGFQDLPAPDMETWSKALNAGQYPLSVLGMTERAAALYRAGIYGNTMTSNPRALDVAVAVFEQLTPEVRENIRVRGRELLDRFERLAADLNGAITKVQGTGLLFSVELAERYTCYGAGSTEEHLRKQGLGVIHGGKRSLRFTPVFDLGADEVDLIVAMTEDALRNGPGAA